LDGDLEISRKQATIERLADGRFAITCEGRNALEVAGREVTQGDRVEFAAGEVIKIGIYKLLCQAQVSLTTTQPDA
jgi:allophanate hydrolase subunit 2